MKKLAYLLFICICLTGCQKCKKKNDPKTDYGTFVPPINLSDYCYFKQGSYWVYQDSISGKIDCTYVSFANKTTYSVTVADNRDYVGEFNYYDMHTIDGIGDKREYEIWDEDAAASAKCCNGRYYVTAHWNRPAKLDSTGNVIVSGVYYGAYTHMFNVFNNGITGGSGSGEQCTSRGSVNSLTINTNIFTDIAVFENFKNISDQNWVVHPYRFKNYISKNIGVIKRIDTDSNRVWLLKRYNVLQ